MQVVFYSAGTTINPVTTISGGTLNKNQSFGLTISLGSVASLPTVVKGTTYDLQIEDDSGKLLTSEPGWKYNDCVYQVTDVNGATTFQNVQLFFGH